MTDPEITQDCAIAMGFKLLKEGERCYDGYPVTLDCWVTGPESFIACYTYDPIHDDAQAMALVKKFNLCIFPPDKEADYWAVESLQSRGQSADLNRAICECVAKINVNT